MESYRDEKPQDSPLSASTNSDSASLWEEVLATGNPWTTNSSMTLRHMTDAQGRLFCNPEKMKFDIHDAFDDDIARESGVYTCKRTINQQIQLGELLSGKRKPHTRFISICAPNSIKPLQVTSKAMETLLSSHKVGSDFSELLLSFANGGKECEAGPGGLIFKQQPDGVVEMQYRINYVEQAGSSWATRQVGVYYRRVPARSQLCDLWIFLHPKNNSVLQKRLENVVFSYELSGAQGVNWDLVHLLVLSSYFGDWRWFLKSLSGDIELLANDALSLDFSNEAHDKRGLETLQSLHHLEDKILPLAARLRSTLETVTILEQNKDLFFLQEDGTMAINVSHELRSYQTRLKGHLESVELLEKRTQEILKLLSVALSLNSQATATKINRNILSLTHDTVDDSATVRVVTVVTLIYLPASFITGVLGMNLFTFQSQTNPDSGFMISPDFWIFIALALPLTLLTVGSWYWKTRSRKKQKDAKRIELLAGRSEV